MECFLSRFVKGVLFYNERCTKGVPFVNERYTKGVSFLPKMIYKGVRGQTSERSIPVLIFSYNPPPTPPPHPGVARALLSCFQTTDEEGVPFETSGLDFKFSRQILPFLYHSSAVLPVQCLWICQTPRHLYFTKHFSDILSFQGRWIKVDGHQVPKIYFEYFIGRLNIQVNAVRDVSHKAKPSYQARKQKILTSSSLTEGSKYRPSSTDGGSLEGI